MRPEVRRKWCIYEASKNAFSDVEDSGRMKLGTDKTERCKIRGPRF